MTRCLGHHFGHAMHADADEAASTGTAVASYSSRSLITIIGHAARVVYHWPPSVAK